MEKEIESGKKKNEYPLVSIIVRTCNRPQLLRRALNSIRKQTYPNIETVIVEDGKNIAEELVKKEYADLKYIYEAVGRQVGRSKAGNRAMRLSTGKYLNFLDDDDALMPEHVAILVKALEGREEKAAYSVAEERQIVMNGYCIEPQVKKKYIRFRQPFYRLLLYVENYIPIQCMMFERSLFEKAGGLDEQLERLEDWDLWVRYSTMTNFVFVDQVTSYYQVPYLKSKRKKRTAEFRNSVKSLHEKFKGYKTEVTVEDMNREMMYVIREYKEHRVIRTVRLAMRVIFFGER